MPESKRELLKTWKHQEVERIPLTPDLLQGFVMFYLFERFDSPKKTPPLHRAIWEAFCSPHPLVAIAAPRGFAKSTAGTMAFGLASVLFGSDDHVLIISSTETMASDHLKDIGMELEENEEIKEHFKILLVVSNGEEIQGFIGGRPFRIICKGAVQRVRGIKWRHKRPSLILIDDLEDDEAVESNERRIKLREWMDNAVLPLGSDNCRIRALGTILHFDSWLNGCMLSDNWYHLCFSAHKDFDDFSELLWPEKFTEERLRRLRALYVDSNNPSGYSKEYLNKPIPESDAYFKRSDFLPMLESDHASPKNYYVGGDLAISQNDRANHTSFTVGGIDPTNALHIVDNHTGRWDSLQIIDKMFEIQRIWKPDLWFLEKGQIEESLMPFLRMEMLRRGVFMNIKLMLAQTDKRKRAQGIRARMRSHTVKHDKNASWYAPYEMELLQFPRSSNDDRVDSVAWLGIGCDEQHASLTVKELVELEWEEEEAAYSDEGRNEITGY